ncbi:MAG: D-alanine--D-alanine ligase [Phycisphaeraceae bacterium]|nr:D-alanine--D-alanine ligase [Phycisphaeraceae bacterium]
MTSRPRVLVLMGGPDRERDVSMVSGSAIAAALAGSGEAQVRAWRIDDPDEFERDLPGLLERTDVVFPALHGRWGEGGGAQRLLERAGATFVGTASGPAAWAMDKVRTKRAVISAGVRTPTWSVLEPGAPCPLGPPLVLKPIDDGSSIDLRIAFSAAEIAAHRADLESRHPRLLAEHYHAGREITVGILEGEVLPIIEIVPEVGVYDYAAKYDRNDTRYVVNPDLPAGVAETCRRNALTAWRLLGLRDLARADFIVDHTGAWFLEINTMPGFTGHSLLPMAALARGIDPASLCLRLVRAALARSSNPQRASSRSKATWPHDAAPDARRGPG